MKTVSAPAMLPVGTRLFAPSASALVDTLFAPSGKPNGQKGTADGIYSVRKRGVMFKRPDGSPFAFGSVLIWRRASKPKLGGQPVPVGISLLQRLDLALTAS